MIALDDNIEDHPKFVGLSPAAAWLWVRGNGYCRRNRTDGFIPEPAALARASKKVIAELCAPPKGAPDKAPLWSPVPGGYQVHDYLDWNPSRAELEAETERKRSAGRAGGSASGEARRKRLGLDRLARPEAEPKQPASDSFVNRSTETNPSSGSGSGSDPVSKEISPGTSSPPSLSGGGPGGGGAAATEQVLRGVLETQRKLAGLDVAAIARDLADQLVGATMGTKRAKTAEQLASDVTAAVFELPEHPAEDVVRRKLRSFVVNGGWDRRVAAGPAQGRSGASVQHGPPAGYLEREASVQAAHRADVDARLAAERARPPGERDPFGPDLEEDHHG